MTLFISADEVVKVLDMSRCIEAMERVFGEEAEGNAVNHPRQRYTLPRSVPLGSTAFWTNMIAGAAASTGFAAMRLDAGIVREWEAGSGRRMDWSYPDGRSWGFVVLFSLQSGAPVAIYQDFSVSPIRVAATTAIAVRKLARKDARVLGLFGTGNEAQRHIEAIPLVTKVEKAKVFSPNKDHLDDFVLKMSKRVELDIEPVNGPDQVVSGSDIVMCATNSSVPVFDGNTLESGQLVATIANTDHNTRRTEADRTTFERSNLIVLNSKETAISNQQRELLDLIDSGSISWDNVKDLSEVILNPSLGRKSDSDIIYYKSNAGVGIQFAAAGQIIYEECLSRGLGTEVPTELFGADVSGWLKLGFSPSP